MALTAEQLANLYGKRRKRGLYEDYMHVLMESDDPGVDPAEEWPTDFGQKNATTMYQGFRNAREKLGLEDQVDVQQTDGHVFILVTARVAKVLEAHSNGNGNGNGNTPEPDSK